MMTEGKPVVLEDTRSSSTILSNQVKRILIIAPQWVGDAIMAESLFSNIQQHDVKIDVLCQPFLAPLFTRMSSINRVHPVAFKRGSLSLQKRWKVGRSLRGRYDEAVVLPNSWKSALVPFFARIPIRSGWRGEYRYGLLTDCRRLNKKQYPLMVQRFVALASHEDAVVDMQLADIKAVPYPVLKANAQQLQLLTKQYQLLLSTPIMIVAPGAAFGEAKRWPIHYFVELAMQQCAAGWQVWVLGGENDHALGEEIHRQIPQDRVRNFCGKTNLGQAIDLMSLAQIVVSNDSGLMHMAAALNVPLVALYGSSSPQFTPPLAKRVKILSLDLPCAPCFQRTCPLGHLDCMNKLMPKQVIDAVCQVLKK